MLSKTCATKPFIYLYLLNKPLYITTKVGVSLFKCECGRTASAVKAVTKFQMICDSTMIQPPDTCYLFYSLFVSQHSASNLHDNIIKLVLTPLEGAVLAYSHFVWNTPNVIRKFTEIPGMWYSSWWNIWTPHTHTTSLNATQQSHILGLSPCWF